MRNSNVHLHVPREVYDAIPVPVTKSGIHEWKDLGSALTVFHNRAEEVLLKAWMHAVPKKIYEAIESTQNKVNKVDWKVVELPNLHLVFFCEEDDSE